MDCVFIHLQYYIVLPFRAHSGLQEIPIATQKDSGVLCFPSRRGLIPRVHPGLISCRTDDTTLMAESEELKSLLMKVKEENKKLA